MQRRFVKMHGCGNDFAIFDERVSPVRLHPASIQMMADRHRGIGFDQLICLMADPEADAFMKIYNADGTEAGACGNATRCVADILMRETGREDAVVKTVSGRLPALRRQDGWIEVDMGLAYLDWEDIPLARPMDTLHLDLPGDPAAASMGNPHLTFLIDDIDQVDIPMIGPRFEHDALFPQRSNVGFAQIIDRTSMRLRVWERGAGLTLACGSGACAAVVNACRRGVVDRACRVIVDGGLLDICWRDDGHVTMAGTATTAYAGEVSVP
jgi:diaminopimelate epimerase